MDNKEVASKIIIDNEKQEKERFIRDLLDLEESEELTNLTEARETAEERNSLELTRKRNGEGWAQCH